MLASVAFSKDTDVLRIPVILLYPDFSLIKVSGTLSPPFMHVCPRMEIALKEWLVYGTPTPALFDNSGTIFECVQLAP